MPEFAEAIQRALDRVERFSKSARRPHRVEAPSENFPVCPPVDFAESLKENPGRTIARIIDHTALKPDLGPDDIRKLCREAMSHHFYAVCVNSALLPVAVEALAPADIDEGSPWPRPRVAVVTGFPHGNSDTRTKAYETMEAVRGGADEIDTVIAVGRLKCGDFNYVLEDLRAVVMAAGHCPVKVILETSLLTDEEKIIGVLLAEAAGAYFVKTSTGFAGGGATPRDVKLMRRVVNLAGGHLGVKASGGVRSFIDAVAMVEAGANRIGTSGGIGIVTGAEAAKGGY